MTTTTIAGSTLPGEAVAKKSSPCPHRFRAGTKEPASHFPTVQTEDKK
jgi:hypothetical protein